MEKNTLIKRQGWNEPRLAKMPRVDVEKNKNAGFRRLLLALIVTLFSPIMLSPVELAHALSWQWTSLPGRERMTLLLDNPGQASIAQRVGTTSIAIPLGNAATSLERQGNAPANTALVANASLNGGQVLLELASPAFGFIVTQPNPRSLVLDIYPDQMGARWKSPGVIAPAGSVNPAPPTAAAARTNPVPPQTGQTPATQTPAANAPNQGGLQNTNAAAELNPRAIAPMVEPPRTPVPTPVITPVITPTPVTTPTATTPTPTPTPVLTPTPTPVPTATTPTPVITPTPTPVPTTGTPTPVPTATTPIPSTATPAATATAPAQPTPAQPAVTNAAPVQNPEPNAAPRNGKSKRKPINVTPGNALNPTGTFVFPAAGAGTKKTRTATNASPQAGAVNAGSELKASLNPIANSANPVNAASPASPNAPATLATDATAPLSVTAIAPPPGTTPSPFVVPPSNTASTPLVPATPAMPLNSNAAPVLEQNTHEVVGSLQTGNANPQAATPQTVTPPPVSPTVRARLNDGPPEAWSADQILSSTSPLSPLSPAPATPVTPAPGTITPLVSTPAPVTPAPGTVAPLVSTPAPGTVAPLVSTPAPGTPAPGTPAPGTITPLVEQNSALAPPANTNQSQPGTAPAENSLPNSPENTPVPGQAGAAATADPAATAENPAISPSLSKPLENDFTIPAIGTPEKVEEKEVKKETETSEKAATDPNQPPIFYVDEQGNPTDPPPDIDQLTADMRKEITGGNYTAALPILERLRKANISPEVREELLYNTMNALFETNQPDFIDKSYETVVRAANEALNYNTKSLRVPDALLILGRVNLAVGNIQDAEGYIKLLQRDYPQHQGVTASLLALGNHYMGLLEYPKAVSLFQTILQDYPESAVGKDAARLQAMALYRQGHFDRALTLLDFVDRRWPRVHLEDPEYLLMAGDVQYQQARLKDALDTYWLQYNLQPTAPSTPFTLMRIATIYFMLKDNELAHEVMLELNTKFPTSPEAPLSLLYTGENGIYEGNPSLDELFAIFEAPNPRIPELYYDKILAEYPNSPQVLTASLRKVAWQLWTRNHMEAMHLAAAFMDAHPDKPEYTQAKEILLRTFAQELGVATSEENFERVLTLWEAFPQVHDYYKPLENELRVALARAQLNRGKEKEGLELLAPFLEGPEDPLYGLYTYNLFLAALLRDEDWSGILNLGDKVSTWKLPQDVRDQLDYSMAIAAENTNLSSRALPLWKKLAPNTSIPLYQRAYAAYFLARDSERRQDLRDTYQYNLDALAMFRQLEEEQSPYADSARIRESIAALMDVTEVAGRIAESLEWAAQYAQFVPDTSPDYAGLRFREARLHRKMGDMARWRALLDGIVSREPDSVFGKMAASELRTQEVARDLARFATE